MKVEIKTVSSIIQFKFSLFKEQFNSLFKEIPEVRRKNFLLMKELDCWKIQEWGAFNIYQFHCSNTLLHNDDVFSPYFTHTRVEYLKQIIRNNHKTYNPLYSGFFGQLLEQLFRKYEHVYIFHEPDIRSIFVFCKNLT